MSIRKYVLLFSVVLLSACATKDGVDDSGVPPYGAGRDDITQGPDIDSESLYGEGYAGAATPGTQQDLVVNVGDRVFFGFDRYDLTEEARHTLQLQAEWLKTYPHLTITIEGHADERGTREYNLALGERRATAVKNYLIALGVSSSRVSTISYGKERPAVTGSNPSAWAQNRRSVTEVD